MGLRMKNFKIMEKSLKNLIFKGGSQKTNMQGELPKKDVGLGKKEGGWELIPQCSLCMT